MITPPSFELREYRISESLDSFEYQWRVQGNCTKKIIFCFQYETLIQKEVIKFYEKDKIKRFLDAGFILKRREMP